MEIKQLWKPFENFLNSHTLARQLHFNGIRKIQSERWIGELDYHYCCCCYCWMLLLLLWRFCAAVSKKQEWHHATKWSQQRESIIFSTKCWNFLDPKSTPKRVSENKDKEHEKGWKTSWVAFGIEFLLKFLNVKWQQEISYIFSYFFNHHSWFSIYKSFFLKLNIDFFYWRIFFLFSSS